MKVYEFKVKQYMTKPSTPEFNFMETWNHNNPMPLMVMSGTIEKETKGMYYLKLHGALNQVITQTCMKCGKPITNEVSKYFGLGPKCGGHDYVNPFSSKEELDAAVEHHKRVLRDIQWEGYVPKSAVTNMQVIGDDGREESKPVKEATITLDKPKALKGNDYTVFMKIPYDDVILASIRTFPYRAWDKETKQWEFNMLHYQNLLDLLKSQGYKTSIVDNRAPINEEESKSEKNASPANYEFKTQPFKHQMEGFEFGITHDRWLLADSPGLGKTKQLIDIACARKIPNTKCLIVCGVNGLKWNWQNEILIHSGETGHILGQRIMKRKGTMKIGSNKDKLEDIKNIKNIDSYFIITNVESLRDENIAKELQKLCKNNTIRIVACDEIHKVSHSSQQGKGFLKLQSMVRVAMTGTPVMNKPLDLYPILKWLGYETHAFYSFKNHYCVMGGFGGYEILGYKNLDELRAKLESIMLRRLKEDVLDLPEKLFIDEYVDMTPKQSIIYKEVTSDIQAHIDEVKTAPNPLGQLIRLRQATGYTGILSSDIQESAKLDRMLELVDESVDNGSKVIVFSNWTKITDPVYKMLKSYNPRLITGDTKDEIRQQYVDDFQNDPNVKVMCGTIGALGTGLTLTAADVVIFLDEPWHMAAKQQAMDRAHRIGQNSNVTIYTIMCKGTIDEKINTLVKGKGEMADYLVDGQIVGNKEALIDYLLG